jgi:hypothetical protein
VTVDGLDKLDVGPTRIVIAVVLREPEITFEGGRKMHLTIGEELEHARTPPYPDTQYSLTLTKILQA